MIDMGSSYVTYVKLSGHWSAMCRLFWTPKKATLGGLSSPTTGFVCKWRGPKSSYIKAA